MPKTYTVHQNGDFFFVQSSDSELFGPYTRRTNANRRARQLRAAAEVPEMATLANGSPIPAQADFVGIENRIMESLDGGAPEPDGVGIDSPNAYERHQARVAYATKPAFAVPPPRARKPWLGSRGVYPAVSKHTYAR